MSKTYILERATEGFLEAMGKRMALSMPLHCSQTFWLEEGLRFKQAAKESLVFSINVQQWLFG